MAKKLSKKSKKSKKIPRKKSLKKNVKLKPIKKSTVSEQKIKTVDEEIADLVQKVRETSDEAAFGKVYEYLSYYISMFSRKYRIPGCDAAEIEQECLCALRYKAIKDFNIERGKFKSFAVLCIKRHFFSLIKGSNQLKRRVLNTSISLDQERMEDGESLSLGNLISKNSLSADEQLSKDESYEVMQSKLLSKLSSLEQAVLKLYLQRMHYDEIVVELNKIFPNKKYSKKAADNALSRARSKAAQITLETD